MLSYGNKDIKLIECINPYFDKWRIRWNLRPFEKEGKTDLVSFEEFDFTHKPSIDEIKFVIEGWYNNKIQEKIKSGFIWKNGDIEYPVWLSEENQFNYKNALDLASQTKGATLPVTFKFGDVNNKLYHTFNTTDELRAFNRQIYEFIQSELEVGWKNKDEFDYTKYQ